MSIENVVGVASTVIALIAAMVSWHFARDSRRQTRENLRLAKVALATDYLQQVRSWASEACEALSECGHLSDLDVTETSRMEEARHDLRVRLSSQIDRGRWFFPNVEAGSFGAQKQSAFRGFRHETLDPLVSAYRLLNDLKAGPPEENKRVCEQISEQKRNFVSKVHELIEPLHRSKAIDLLLQEFAEPDSK